MHDKRDTSDLKRDDALELQASKLPSQGDIRPLRRDDLIDRLRLNIDRLKKERVGSPRDGFVAAVAHFALSLDAIGMYPPKLIPDIAQSSNSTIPLDPTASQLATEFKRALIENGILRGICASPDEHEQMIRMLERSDALKAAVDLITNQKMQTAYNNGRNINVMPAENIQGSPVLPLGFPDRDKIERFIRIIFRDRPAFLISKVLDSSLEHVNENEQANRRARGQVYDCLFRAGAGPESPLTKWVSARLMLCDVDLEIGKHFRQAAENLDQLRAKLSGSRSNFGTPAKGITEYVKDTVDVANDLYLLGLRDRLAVEVQELAHSVFQSQGGSADHEAAVSAILLALTTRLRAPFSREQLFDGALYPAFEAINQGRFADLYTLVFRIALICPETIPVATSHRLGIPEELRDILDLGRISVARHCGLLRDERTRRYDPQVDRVLSEELTHVVAKLNGMRNSINVAFLNALDSTVEILREAAPDIESLDYTIGAAIDAREAFETYNPDFLEESYNLLRDSADIDYLTNTLGGNDIEFIRPRDNCKVHVHASDWSHGQKGIIVRISYVSPNATQRYANQTLVAKVRANLANGTWIPQRQS